MDAGRAARRPPCASASGADRSGPTPAQSRAGKRRADFCQQRRFHLPPGLFGGRPFMLRNPTSAAARHVRLSAAAALSSRQKSCDPELPACTGSWRFEALRPLCRLGRRARRKDTHSIGYRLQMPRRCKFISRNDNRLVAKLDRTQNMVWLDLRSCGLAVMAGAQRLVPNLHSSWSDSMPKTEPGRIR